MKNNLENYIQDYLSESGSKFSGDSGHFFLHLNDTSAGCFEGFTLSRSTILGINDIHSMYWPCPPADMARKGLVINICLDGRCETKLDGNRSVILSKGEMIIGRQQAAREFYYPTELYQGIQLFIMTANLSEDDYFSMSGIDLENLQNKYCREGGIFFSHTPEEILETTEKIWALRGTDRAGEMRFLSADLMLRLDRANPKTKDMRWLTKSQVEIVKKAVDMLSSDLSAHITAASMAENFGISETSFKNYFRSVLGERWLDYLQRIRMKKASELLRTTDDNIADIAASIGYQNHGKFSSVFKALNGMTPSEYRRMERLSASSAQ